MTGRVRFFSGISVSLSPSFHAFRITPWLQIKLYRIFLIILNQYLYKSDEELSFASKILLIQIFEDFKLKTLSYLFVY
jgi:hypothetical protein